MTALRTYGRGIEELWPGTAPEARRVQEELRKKVRIRPLARRPHTLAALDASYTEDKAIAAVCLYAWPGLRHLEDSVAIVDCDFPYIPGLLTFREGPAAMKALEKLSKKPGLLLCDGQGIAHPRGMGIAAHLGVILGIPSVGCAKSRLVGEFREPAERKGSKSRLFHKNKEIGAVVRTRSGVRPVFVSPGHLIDIPGAVAVVMETVGGFRLPEPIRRAHRLATEQKNVL
jgi:deoxyribonuclease V